MIRASESQRGVPSPRRRIAARDDLRQRAADRARRRAGVLAGAVRHLAEGDGGVVVLDAPAGLGKTALLERAALFAADRGCLVRRAAPGPLERHFPFGVVRALLEAPLRDASAQERAQLLDGAAAAAGTLLLEGTVPGGDSTMLLAHSVLWLCAAIAETRPLALVVDDAQWADRSSLEVLAYLARRIDDLPLLIAVGARADDPRAPSDLLSLLGGVRSRHRPAPAAPHTPRRGAAHPPPRAGHLGGRVPRLPSRRRRQPVAAGRARPPDRHARPRIARAGGDDAPPVSAIARNVIRWRLATLTARDRAVAAALAVIGDGALPHVVAAVAGVAVAQLAPARDALLAAGLLDPDGERLAHGLVAAAIGEDLTRTECERLHREAARALMAGPAEADVVASHLLQCRPQADPEVSGLLVHAASTAARRGAPHTAAAYLERALAGARARRRPRPHARAAGDGGLRRGPARFAAAAARRAARGARSREPRRRAHAPGRAQRPGHRRRRSRGALRAGAGRRERSRRAAGGRGRLARRADDDPRPPRRAGAARGRDRSGADDGSAARTRDRSRIAPGSGSSSARPDAATCAALARRGAARATSCSTRPAGARPTTSACARW